jgi:hypothetical protein
LRAGNSCASDERFSDFNGCLLLSDAPELVEFAEIFESTGRKVWRQLADIFASSSAREFDLNHARAINHRLGLGIAARDAAPYVHPKMRPAEEEQPQQVHVMQWNWTPELLAKLRDIRRGKPFQPFILERSDGLASSITQEQDVSRNPDQSDEQREGAKEPSDSISPSPKKHWAN